MTRLLLSLFLFVVALGGMNAQVVFDFTDPVGLGFDTPAASSGTDIPYDKPLTKDGVNITFTKGSATINPRFWGGTKAVDLRVYKGSSMTIGASYAMASIEFDGAAVAALTASEGTFSNGVWTGNAANVVFSVTATVKIDKITINDNSTKPVVVPPVFSPGANVYSTPVEVSMSCVTEGATIKYSLNEGNEQVYSAPITISSTTTIKAYAEKGTEKSSLVEAYYEIKNVTGFDNVAKLYTANKGDLVRFDCPLIVTYQDASYLYVQDKDKNHMLIYAYDAPRYNRGDNIPAGVEGAVDIYEDVKQLRPTVSTLKEATPGTAEPTVITTDVMKDIAYVHKYVEVRNSTITSSLLTDNKGNIAVYNKFKVTIPTDGEKYNNRGIVAMYNGGLQYYPIEFADATALKDVKGNVTKVHGEKGMIRLMSSEDASVVIFNATGQTVKTVAMVAGEAVVSMAQGLYIVKIGNNLHKVIVR